VGWNPASATCGVLAQVLCKGRHVVLGHPDLEATGLHPHLLLATHQLCIHEVDVLNIASALDTMLEIVKPNFSAKTLGGAEAPNRSRLII
jgi:hypothetical protein